MAEIASIIQVVAWGARLSLSLYDFAAACPAATRDANRLAKSVSLFSLMLKQVGTSLKEDNTIPSVEAAETVQDVTVAANDVFAAVQNVAPGSPSADGHVDDGAAEERWDATMALRCRYLLCFVDSLNSTLSVMLQAFYTVRVIAWSRSRGDRLPVSAADAVDNERLQLEVIVIEQQLILLETYAAYAEFQRHISAEGKAGERRRADTPLGEKNSVPSPDRLEHFKEDSLRDVHATNSVTESSRLVRRISYGFSFELLTRWTQLLDIERRLPAPDDDADTPRAEQPENTRRTSWQPPESSRGAEHFPVRARPGGGNIMSPQPHRPPSLQINDMEHRALPIPTPAQSVHNRRPSGPISPMSSAYGVSPTSTGYFPGSPVSASKTSPYVPGSPRSSMSSLNPSRAAGVQDGRDRMPSVAAAATSAGPGVAWRLWLQSNRWDFVDDKVVSSNAQVPVEQAFTDRSAWTEIMQRWVRREALEEARYSFNQVQKEVPDASGRTKFETCFCVGKGLTFPEIQRLVNRTVEIYRHNYMAAPPPQAARMESGRSHHEDTRSSRHSRRYDSSATSDSESDYRRRHSRRSTGSTSKHRPHSRKESSRGGGGGGGGSTFGTLAKVGGIATLLEGLPEILSGL